jgi:hypothetical protein
VDRDQGSDDGSRRPRWNGVALILPERGDVVHAAAKNPDSRLVLGRDDNRNSAIFPPSRE